MATVWKKFTGEIGWNHLVTPDSFRGTTRWVMDFIPDDYAAIKAAGSQLRLDKDTGTFIRPRRDTVKRIKGEDVEFTPPKLFNKDGTPFERGFIGKGSKVEITVSIYDSGSEAYGKGTRLEEVRILEEVEWVRDSDEDEVKDAEVVEEKPPVEEAKKSTKPKLPF